MDENICGSLFRAPLSEKDIDGGKRLRVLRVQEGNNDRPLITYITVVYNNVSMLFRCMESVWSQTYDNIEYIIIDGGSTDGTIELIQEHEENIDYFVSQSDKGVYDAMNKGIRLAKGDFICFINSDDYALPNAAQTIVDLYQSTGSMLLAGRRFLELEEHPLFEEEDFPRFLFPKGVLKHNRLWHQSLYTHRDAFNRIGYIPLEYPIIGDFVWTCRAIDNNIPITLTDEKLSCFHWGGVSSDYRKLQCEMICHIRENFPFLSKTYARFVYICLEPTYFPKCSIFKLFCLFGRYYHKIEFKKVFFLSALSACVDELYTLSPPGSNEVAEFSEVIYQYLHTLEEINWSDFRFLIDTKRKIEHQYIK